jgi:hypothetical protein
MGKIEGPQQTLGEVQKRRKLKDVVLDFEEFGAKSAASIWLSMFSQNNLRKTN